MSSGPIAQERAGSRVGAVSTANEHRVCMRAKGGRGYCGRTSAKTTVTAWSLVVCSDCAAAGRADGLDAAAAA